MITLAQSKDTSTSSEILDETINTLINKDYGTYEKNDISILLNILNNPNSSSETLSKCIFDLSYKLLFTTVQIPNKTFNINKQFKNYTKLRIELKTHNNVTQEILDKMAKDLRIKYIKESDILDTLSRDIDPFVRTLVAHNANTSKDTLNNLLSDKNDIVRYASLKHLDINMDILDKLSYDNAIDIKILVASNLDTTLPMLERLSLTDDQNLNNAIEKHHNSSDAILEVINKRREDEFSSLLGF